MHNYYFSLRLLCWAVLFLGVPTTSTFANTLGAEAPIPPSCNLPAPTNLIVTGTTANSISIAWNPVGGANGYATEFVEIATGNVAFGLNVAGTNVTAAPLLSGTKYRFTVRAICPDGTVSGRTGKGEAATQFIIVDDIVASFPTHPDPINNCTTFPVGNEVKLMASSEGSEGGGEFKVTIGGDNNYLSVIHQNAPNPNFEKNWVFTNETNVIPIHSFTTAKVVKVFYGEGTTVEEIAGSANNLKMTFKVERVGLGLSQIYLCPSYLEAGYGIYSEYIPIGGKPGHNTTSTRAAFQNTLLLSPNPFNEELNLQFDKGAVANTNIILMDMQGRTLLTQNIEAGTQNITIPTADFLPGIYMVRYETKTGVKTYKMIKTYGQ